MIVRAAKICQFNLMKLSLTTRHLVPRVK